MTDESVTARHEPPLLGSLNRLTRATLNKPRTFKIQITKYV